MSAPKGQSHDPRRRHQRRRLVQRLRFEKWLPYEEISTVLRDKHGITASAATVQRDVMALRAEFGERGGRNFDVLAEIGEARHGFRAIRSRALRAADKTTDGGQKARLLMTALRAARAEFELLQSTGLVPKNLGDLRIIPEAPTERINGVELQKLFDSIEVTEADITSEAERDYLHGDWAAHERASKDAKH